jgi:glutamate synthase domain-containing protein 3
VAKGLLRDWPEVAKRFVKIIPLDYRRVLEEQLRASRARGAGASDTIRA